MARNKMTDLNDHIFASLERLNDEGLNKEQIESETSKAKSIANLAGVAVKNFKVMLEVSKTIQKGQHTDNTLHKLIGVKDSEN